ncbi:hypothetical protein HN865_02610 [Candidatus Woesearchaeota archaeon]|jgi:hypothetical protein|nr:hypothetical protein [Candidatus Woesearchaeota archaeon]
MVQNNIQLISPGTFEAEKHYYPKVINAQIHPLISYFFNMSKVSLIKRYCHLNPQVKKEKLLEILTYQPAKLRWAGADLFYATTDTGRRKMVVLETNSCPSGQKSMPLRTEDDELGGYRFLLEKIFCPLLKNKRLPNGKLAVIYDKNYMEASGYASALSELENEEVLLVSSYKNDPEPLIRFTDGILEVRYNSTWQPIRAAFRYITQTPWNRIPIHTKTLIFNPILACLAGGRNKMVAAKAYDIYNSELEGSGLSIVTPETIYDVSKEEIPLWVTRFGGHAVVKIPYSNAGQGVFTITNEQELDHFMSQDYDYNQFIVQSLIGNSEWSSHTKSGKLYHIGTIPNKKGNIFVADLRMMLISTKDGFRSTALYARKAAAPLKDTLEENSNSWEMLGTNLSIKLGKNDWDSETSRLLMMDCRDFNQLGIGIDDLIEGFVQTILAIIAIDKMAMRLVTKSGKFRLSLFKSLNNDQKLLDELIL